jgi:hypothetical protein
MTPLAVDGQLEWDPKPGRWKRDNVCRSFDEFQPAGLVELDRLGLLVGYRLGLPAHDVAGPKLMLQMGGLADTDGELAFGIADASLGPQDVSQVAVVLLIE